MCRDGGAGVSIPPEPPEKGRSHIGMRVLKLGMELGGRMSVRLWLFLWGFCLMMFNFRVQIPVRPNFAYFFEKTVDVLTFLWYDIIGVLRKLLLRRHPYFRRET